MPTKNKGSKRAKKRKMQQNENQRVFYLQKKVKYRGLYFAVCGKHKSKNRNLRSKYLCLFNQHIQLWESCKECHHKFWAVCLPKFQLNYVQLTQFELDYKLAQKSGSFAWHFMLLSDIVMMTKFSCVLQLGSWWQALDLDFPFATQH